MTAKLDAPREVTASLWDLDFLVFRGVALIRATPRVD
jgi:hypothetical protein